MLSAGVRAGIGCSNQSSRGACHRQLPFDSVLLKVRDGQPREMDHRENVQLEELTVDVDVDFVPFGSLRASSVVHENVKASKVTDNSVEALLVISELQHIERNDENVFGA